MKTLCAFLLIISCVLASETGGLARGWNDKIAWKTFENGLKESQETNVPAMVIIHKTWCGACKNLKGGFSSSKDIEDLSKQFVMVILRAH
jgi:protein-disulfide reductase (glutathione)